MLPVKLIEYITCNLAVISTGLDVVRNYFDEKMIYYVAPDDVIALAKAINSLYSSIELRKKYSQNAKRFVDVHNWPNEKQKLISLYNGFLK